MIPKYRAWDKEFKEMVSVDALVFDEQVIKATYQNGSIVKDDVKNYELMQSTGLRDKDGKEIFDGDIVGIGLDTSIIYVNVYWDSEHALFMMESKEYDYKEALAELFEDYTYPFMVVGNIYEDDLRLR